MHDYPRIIVLFVCCGTAISGRFAQQHIERIKAGTAKVRDT